MVYLKELYVSAALAAINAGKTSPDEQTVTEALSLLQKQYKSAKGKFAVQEKAMGFGVG